MKAPRPRRKAMKKRNLPPKPEIVQPTNIEKTKSEGAFKLKIFMNGNVFETASDSLLKAITNFAPGQIKSKVVFQVSYKDLMREKVLIAPRAKQIFSNEISARVFVKSLELSLHV